MKQTLKIAPQKGSYKNSNEYYGMVGEITICDKCCNGALRVQFLGVANNELLDNFNLSKCIFFT